MTDYTEQYRLLRDAVGDLKEGMEEETPELSTQVKVIDRLDLICSTFPAKDPPTWKEKAEGEKKEKEEEVQELLTRLSGGSPYGLYGRMLVPDSLTERRLELMRRARSAPLFNETDKYQSVRQKLIMYPEGLLPPANLGDHRYTANLEITRIFKPQALLIWEPEDRAYVEELRGGFQSIVRDTPAFIFEPNLTQSEMKELVKKNKVEFPHMWMKFDVNALSPGHMLSLNMRGGSARAVGVFGIELSE